MASIADIISTHASAIKAQWRLHLVLWPTLIGLGFGGGILWNTRQVEEANQPVELYKGGAWS